MNFKIISNKDAFEHWLSHAEDGDWNFENGGRAWRHQDEVGWFMPTRKINPFYIRLRK